MEKLIERKTYSGMDSSLDWRARTAMLLGSEAVERLARAHVVIFGLGGVGSHAVEALCRAGIGALTLVDHDEVNVTNINRQIIADTSTLGIAKTDACAARIKLINPLCVVTTHKTFACAENIADLLPGGLAADYIVDAVDTVAAKAAIIVRAHALGIPVISCMGTGGKLDPEGFKIGDIWEVTACPLAKAVRHALRKLGHAAPVCVLHSAEPPSGGVIDGGYGRRAPGSVSYMPAIAGMMMAGKVIAALRAAVDN